MGLDLCAPHNPLSLVHSYFPTGRDAAPLKQEANIFHFSKGIIYFAIDKPAAAKSIQSCLTLCGPIDGSPPGSPTPGILQARTLEWIAVSFSNA